MIMLLMPPIGYRFLQLEGKRFFLLIENQTARVIVADDANTSLSGASREKLKKNTVVNVETASAVTN